MPFLPPNQQRHSTEGSKHVTELPVQLQQQVGSNVRTAEAKVILGTGTN